MSLRSINISVVGLLIVSLIAVPLVIILVLLFALLFTLLFSLFHFQFKLLFTSCKVVLQFTLFTVFLSGEFLLQPVTMKKT